MMLLEIEIMTMQRNVERVNNEDLTEVAIQRCSSKKAFFKGLFTILKTTREYIHFFKVCKAEAESGKAESLQLSQK